MPTSNRTLPLDVVLQTKGRLWARLDRDNVAPRILNHTMARVDYPSWPRRTIYPIYGVTKVIYAVALPALLAWQTWQAWQGTALHDLP